LEIRETIEEQSNQVRVIVDFIAIPGGHNRNELEIDGSSELLLELLLSFLIQSIDSYPSESLEQLQNDRNDLVEISVPFSKLECHPDVNN